MTLLSKALAYRALCLLLTIHESRSNKFLSEGLAFACRCFIAGIDLVITTALSRNTYYNSYSYYSSYSYYTVFCVLWWATDEQKAELIQRYLEVMLRLFRWLVFLLDRVGINGEDSGTVGQELLLATHYLALYIGMHSLLACVIVKSGLLRKNIICFIVLWEL